MGDIGMATQRARDKTEQMQARASALDDELARMKAQLPASAAPPAVEGPE